MDNRIVSRLRNLCPPLLGIAVVLTVFAWSLGTYTLHYFPYEDDYSLLRYSAVENSPVPITWISRGFADYFANDPNCVTNNFGFVRFVVNGSYYLESLFSQSAEGPVLLATNVLSWLISALLLYGIALRLGASRWIASSGIVLFALSPCWYRGLIHSSFRNNGLAACFLLAATYVLLEPGAIRSWWRLASAGALVALAVGCHEQSLTNLPIFVLGLLWLGFTTQAGQRIRTTVLAIAAVIAPSLLLVLWFRHINPLYGRNYAATGFLGTVEQSDRLAALGIHSHLLIASVKLPLMLLGAIVGAANSLTPFSGDNMLTLNPHFGWIVFALTAIASIAMIRRYPRLMFPIAAFFVYAVVRGIGIPAAEPRFMHMEVAWGIIVLVCALSAGCASGNRTAILAGAGAGVALLAFSVGSYDASIVKRHSFLVQRNAVDREAFSRIRAAASQYPDAEVILVNDQAGMWSARAMLELAGFKAEDFEITPTINNLPSTDVLRTAGECPVSSEVVRLPSSLQARLTYSSKCNVTTFGRDLACSVLRYRKEGRPYATAWSTCLKNTLDTGPCAIPLIQDMPIESGRPLVIVRWRDRLSVPDVKVLSDEEGLASQSW